MITKRPYMAHAKKKPASDAVTEGGSVICKKLPCDRDDSILLRYIKNLPAARESKGRLHFFRNVSNKGLLDENSVQVIISGV